MTTSTEAPESDSRADGHFLRRWRAAMAEEQCAVLPRGRVAVSCSAPLGKGGLGRHLQEILAALARGGQPTSCICGSNDAFRAPARRSLPGRPDLWSATIGPSRLPLPLPADLRALAFASEFDAHAARRLASADHLIAFNGQALTQFGVARREGYSSTALVSANSHMRRVIRQHERARSQYPLERSWTTRLLGRNLQEYARADVIYVASRYVRESFLEEGFPEHLLAQFPLTPDPRFDCARSRAGSDRFDVVYSGSLAVHKGVPLLIDAFRRLPYADMRLKLVGGWGTRGMRRFVESACAADSRITAGPGDPLPHLRGASLSVHPAYEDGFAYAPAEALACGVPVLVSEDTGMKDLIDAPRTGLILPTGDLEALTEAMQAAYRGEAFGVS